jgi:uncharacterized membrane protein (DUF106 family)
MVINSNQIDMKNQINLTDLLMILFLAFLTNAFSEFLSWLFIYRKKKYRENKKQIDLLNKKIELAKETLLGKSKQLDKKIKQQEADLKTLNAEMMKVKLYSNYILKILTRQECLLLSLSVYSWCSF